MLNNLHRGSRKHDTCKIVGYVSSALQSFKVIQGYWNRYQWNGVCDFVLVNGSNFGRILHRFWYSCIAKCKKSSDIAQTGRVTVRSVIAVDRLTVTQEWGRAMLHVVENIAVAQSHGHPRTPLSRACVHQNKHSQLVYGVSCMLPLTTFNKRSK